MSLGFGYFSTQLRKVRRGKVEKTAQEFNKEFLGSLPINQDLRTSADKGEPLTYSNPDHEVSKLFKNIAEKIKQSSH